MKKLMIELKQHVKAYFPIFGMCFAFSFCIYYLLISQGLVNSDDGLWEYDYYKGGRWVISLGRWFIPYLDRLRFGFSMEPATSLITLGLYSLGLMFVLDLLDVGAKRKSGLLACALFMSSVVVCVSLSFRFTSPNYGMAFLLNTAAVWVAVKGKNIFGMLAGGIMIALGMGTYQAYIGCACLVFTGYVMKALGEEQKSMRSILAEIFRFAGMMLTGAILYVLVLNIHLKFFYISMAEYNGAENYSLINTLRSLPFSIPYAYRTFFRYFLGDMAKLNLLQGAGIFILFYVLGGGYFCGQCPAHRKDKQGAGRLVSGYGCLGAAGL